MKTLRKFVLENFRALFYASSITAGIFAAQQELNDNKNETGFVIFTILIILIYLAEVFTQYFQKGRKVQINLNIHDEVNELAHLFHKIILPVALYVSLVGFSFFNFRNKSITLLMIIVLITFFILFINIRAFFERKLTLEHKTNYIYDLIKFIIFFNLVNIFSNSGNSYPSLVWFYALLVGITDFIVLFLMLWRYKNLHQSSAIYSLISSIIIGGVFFALQYGRIVNSLQVSLTIFFVFYLSTAIIHHKMMKTLTKSVLLEYVIIILVVIAITYGIS